MTSKILSEAERKAEIAKLDAQLEQIRLEYPTVLFEPNRVQKAALRMLDEGLKDGIRSYGILPGNGVGKTTLLANLIWNIAAGPQNEWFDLPFIIHWPYRKELRLVCDAADMKEGTGGVWQAIDMWWPKSQYRSSMQGYDYQAAFNLPRGFTLSIRTYNQPRRLHESVSLGAVFLNEPPDNPGIWQQYGARLRGSGFRAVFGTVWEDSGVWIQEELVENPRARFCFGDIHDCCREHFTDGHMAHNDIMEVIADYPEEIREARRTGIFSGLALNIFKVTPAIDCEPEEVPEDSTAYSALDPHPHKPWVYLVGKIDTDGQWWIIDEWPKTFPYHKTTSDQRGLSEYARMINEMDAGNSVRKRVIDRAGSSQQIRKDYGSTTVRQDLLEKHRLRFEDGNRNVNDDGEDIGGITIVRTLIQDGRLHISRNCRNLRYQLENLKRKRNEKGEPTPKIDDKLLDFPRALMYLVMAGFRHKEMPTTEETNRARMTAHERELVKIRRERDKLMPVAHAAIPIQWGNY